MLRFYADKFVKLARFVERVSAIAKYHPNETLKPRDNDPLLPKFDDLRKHCQEINLNLSVIQIDRITEKIGTQELTANAVEKLLENLAQRIDDELSSVYVMTLSQRKVEDYYEKASLFGEEVFNNFPSANYDIEEAGKCFALARYTACVMHLQRVLEIGLKSYGNCLGVMNLITTAQPSWQTVLDKTAKEIKDRNDRQNTNSNWTSNDEKEFCEGVQPFLVAVKTAWRNPSMHADKTYGEEIAEDIFSAVKRFMKHLAEHLNEKGKFTKRRKK